MELEAGEDPTVMPKEGGVAVCATSSLGDGGESVKNT